nr:hypothetical protein [uncultured Draconibacterium sp.]
MEENKSKVHSVHVHFHGTPTPEFMEAFNRMLDIAAEAADKAFLNEEKNARPKEGDIKP